MRKKISASLDKLSSGVSSYFDGKTALTATFAGSVVAANLIASKIAAFNVPLFGTAAAPAGFVALGAAFLCSDALSELYGPKAAHKAVNGTIVAVSAALGLSQLAVMMPSAAFYPLSQEYASVIGASTSISVASLASMAVSQNLDVSIFHKLKSAGASKWVRNIGSTVTSQFVDTALFISLAFFILPHLFDGTVTPLAAIPSLIVSQYVLKVIVAAADTPLFYALTANSR